MLLWEGYCTIVHRHSQYKSAGEPCTQTSLGDDGSTAWLPLGGCTRQRASSVEDVVPSAHSWMAVACSLEPPSINLSSIRPIRRPPGVPSWGEANLTGIVNMTRKQHPFDGLAMFKPESQSPDGWYGALFASQFREKCRRFLILEDDMNLAGFGWTAKILGVALLIAFRTNRVLLERAVDPSWQHATHEGESRKARKHGFAPRWCGRPPFTLQCWYRPWTHCQPPMISAVETPPSFKHWQRYPERHGEVVRVKLSWVQQSRNMAWSHLSKPAEVALRSAIRFLFRPRAWVQGIGSCVLRGAGMSTSAWLSVHVRNSPEKDQELRERGGALETLKSQFTMLLGLASTLRTHRVLLQTASPSQLLVYETFGKANHLSLSFTNNTREEHDNWGGWKHGSEACTTSPATVGAVNAHLGSMAPVFMSPASSAWTDFVLALMPHGSAEIPMCCHPGRPSTPKSYYRACSSPRTRFVAPPDMIKQLAASIPASLIRQPTPTVMSAGSITLELKPDNVTVIWPLSATRHVVPDAPVVWQHCRRWQSMRQMWTVERKGVRVITAPVSNAKQ